MYLNSVLNSNAAPKRSECAILDTAMDDNPKVNVNIPLSLVDVGLKLAKKFDPKLEQSGLDQIDLDEIIEAVKNGAEGKIVDVEDEENQTRVKIYVE